MELRMTRLEDIMDRRPLLLNRFVGGGGFVGVLWGFGGLGWVTRIDRRCVNWLFVEVLGV